MSDAEKEKRCDQCGNCLALCGHDLPFKERIKRIQVNRESLKVREPGK